MKKYIFIPIAILIIILPSTVKAESVTVSSLKELASYAAKSNNRITLKAGKYRLADYLNADSIQAKVQRKDYQYLNFSGDNNIFIFDGVEIEIDTRLRELLKFPIHTSE